MLTDISAPVVLVEAEKTALAIAAAADRAGRPVLPIGCGGCWGWRGRVGKAEDASGARVDEVGPLPDFDRVVWAGREAIILFDVNAATNPKVQAARRALAAELTNRGARVRLCDVPAGDGVNGPDDLIGRYGDAAFWTLLDAPAPSDRGGTKPKKSERAPQGRAVDLDDPDPWPEPVDGAALLDAIAATFARYLALPPHASTAARRWPCGRSTPTRSPPGSRRRSSRSRRP